MKAEMTSGEIVALDKGCDCRTHRIPHWVHMWRSRRDYELGVIKGYLERMDEIQQRNPGGRVSFGDWIDHQQLQLAVSAGAGEMARIYGDALGEFKRRGIVRLIAEESDQLTELDHKRAQQFLAATLPAEPEMTSYLDHAHEVRMTARDAL